MLLNLAYFPISNFQKYRFYSLTQKWCVTWINDQSELWRYGRVSVTVRSFCIHTIVGRESSAFKVDSCISQSAYQFGLLLRPYLSSSFDDHVQNYFVTLQEPQLVDTHLMFRRDDTGNGDEIEVPYRLIHPLNQFCAIQCSRKWMAKPGLNISL